MELKYSHWDRVEEYIDSLPQADLAYLTLKDRGQFEEGEEQMGRVDLDDPQELGISGDLRGEDDWERTKKALLSWIKRTVDDNVVGFETTVVKVMAYRHKGLFIKSVQFTVEDPQARTRLVEWAAPDVHGYEDAKLPEAVDNYGKLNAIRNYDAVMAGMLHGFRGTMGQMLRMSKRQERQSSGVIDRLADQTERLARTNQSLTESLIAGKLSKLDAELNALEAERQAAREEREALERQKMAASAGKLIQETVETVMMGKAISPEMKAVIPLLQGTELEGLIKDPQFQAIMADPEKRKFLTGAMAHMVSQFAGAAQSGQAQGEAPQGSTAQGDAPPREDAAQPGA